MEFLINITDYNSLLAVAKEQLQPQRFLFVFLKKSLPEDHKGDEEFRFNAGMGGELTPVMTLDKPVDELTNFKNLVSESLDQKKQWHIVLVAALAGQNSVMPSSDDALKHLETMMKTVESGGNLAKYMAFDRNGEPIVFGQ